MSALPWLEDTWNRFLLQARGDRLPHALLLAGPAGTGKTAMARELAAWLLCEAPAERACGRCRSCRLLPGGAHPELFWVEPEDERGLLKIGAIRTLIDSLTLTTTISERKVAVLAPAEGMNVNAANALLKCLEEPPGASVLLLVSHDPRRLPVTVRSRCQLLPVALPEPALAQSWLRQVTGAGERECTLALAAAGGRPLLAERLVTDGAVSDFGALQASLSDLLGAPERAAACASELGEQDPRRVWGWLSISLAQALRARLAGEASEWLPSAGRLPPDRLGDLQQRADRNRALAATTVRQDLLLHQWLLEWARLPTETAGSGA